VIGVRQLIEAAGRADRFVIISPVFADRVLELPLSERRRRRGAVAEGVAATLNLGARGRILRQQTAGTLGLARLAVQPREGGVGPVRGRDRREWVLGERRFHSRARRWHTPFETELHPRELDRLAEIGTRQPAALAQVHEMQRLSLG